MVRDWYWHLVFQYLLLAADLDKYDFSPTDFMVSLKSNIVSQDDHAIVLIMGS